jgi:hypothetical protein
MGIHNILILIFDRLYILDSINQNFLDVMEMRGNKCAQNEIFLDQ